MNKECIIREDCICPYKVINGKICSACKVPEKKGCYMGIEVGDYFLTIPHRTPFLQDNADSRPTRLTDGSYYTIESDKLVVKVSKERAMEEVKRIRAYSKPSLKTKDEHWEDLLRKQGYA